MSCRSFFELMLFFSKEEFVEKPLKDILDSFQVTDPLSQFSCLLNHTLHFHNSQVLYFPLVSHEQ